MQNLESIPLPKPPLAPTLVSLEQLLSLRRHVHDVTFVPRRKANTGARCRTTWFVVDQRRSMFCGTRRETKAGTAVELAAAGVWRAFDLGDRAGVVVFDDDEVVEMRSGHGWRHVMRVMQALQETHHAAAAADPSSYQPKKIERVLADLETSVGHDFLAVILSDFDGAGETTRSLIDCLSNRGDVVALPIYDPSSTQFLGRGGATSAISSHSDERRRAHRQLIDFAARRRASAMPWTPELDAPVLPVSAGADSLGQMHRLLGRAVA